MTDAAGSIGPEDAGSLGVTVLDSYLVVGDQAWPETLVAPETLYGAMAAGARVSTAQASVFQRHQSYVSASAATGTCSTSAWGRTTPATSRRRRPGSRRATREGG